MTKIEALENEIENLKRSMYSANDRVKIHMEIEKKTEELKSLRTKENGHGNQ